MVVLIDSIAVGPFAANCYVVAEGEGGKAAVVDPGGDPDAIALLIERHGLEVAAIVNTHGHADHIAANGELARLWKVPIAIHRLDAPMLTNTGRNLSTALGLSITSPEASRLLEDGDILTVGSLAVEVRHTPGHTPGGVSLVVENNALTGDTLFAGSIGRTDFPGGSLQTLLRSIETRLLTLPDGAIVYPGHGPVTTIGEERSSNPFLTLNGGPKSPL